MNQKLKVGIFLFNEVEVLDFAGPFEVFSLASLNQEKLFEVITIAETNGIISARNGLRVLPEFTFDNCPKLDILIIPGGYGAEEIEIKKTNVLDWIKTQSTHVKFLAAVCTGALLLAECGLLNHRQATTHWMDLERLEKEYPLVQVIRNVKFVHSSEIITSGGISAGINMSFYIITQLFNAEVAIHTAKRMEYDILI